MNLRRALAVLTLVILGAASLSPVLSAQRAAPNPKIEISTEKVGIPGHVYVKGAGFTPKHNISSHLRKPDGNEYPVLPILTDEHGEFTHDIETLVLQAGVHELWVVDDASQKSSNHVRFDVR